MAEVLGRSSDDESAEAKRRKKRKKSQVQALGEDREECMMDVGEVSGNQKQGRLQWFIDEGGRMCVKK